MISAQNWPVSECHQIATLLCRATLCLKLFSSFSHFQVPMIKVSVCLPIKIAITVILGDDKGEGEKSREALFGHFTKERARERERDQRIAMKKFFHFYSSPRRRKKIEIWGIVSFACDKYSEIYTWNRLHSSKECDECKTFNCWLSGPGNNQPGRRSAK